MDPNLHAAFLTNLVRCRVDINIEALKVCAGRLSEVPLRTPFVNLDKEIKYYMDTVEMLRRLGEQLRRIHAPQPSDADITSINDPEQLK